MATISTTPGVVAVEVPAFCAASASLGTQTLRRGTFEIDLRPTGALGEQAIAGLQFTSGMRRLQFLAGPNTVAIDEGATIVRESVSGGNFRLVTASSAPIQLNDWTTMRVVLRDDLWSVSLGSAGGFREVLRYQDPDPAPAWRVGVTVVGANPFTFTSARMELRNLTIASESQLPNRGASSAAWAFDADGGAALPYRSRSETGQVRFAACPAFPAAAACADAGACTPPQPICARMVKVGLNAGSLSFDLPVGLDPSQAWRLRFRFAPAVDGGVGPVGPAAYCTAGTLLESETGAWDGGVTTFGQRARLPVNADTWNLIEYQFNPSINRYSVDLNGQAANFPGTPRFPPANADRHVGAIVIGGRGIANMDLWLSDVSISQP
jgi:hypothetical protein